MPWLNNDGKSSHGWKAAAVNSKDKFLNVLKYVDILGLINPAVGGCAGCSFPSVRRDLWCS